MELAKNLKIKIKVYDNLYNKRKIKVNFFNADTHFQQSLLNKDWIAEPLITLLPTRMILTIQGATIVSWV